MDQAFAQPWCEATAAVVRHVGPEPAEIGQALDRYRGDRLAEAQLTGNWIAHLLVCSSALLHNLLIDNA